MRPIEIQPVRPTRPTERVNPTEPVRAAAKVASGEKDVEVSRRELIGSRQAPVDTERVEAIRNAIAEDRYPLIPTKIADAMIAAQLMLRK